MGAVLKAFCAAFPLPFPAASACTVVDPSAVTCMLDWQAEHAKGTDSGFIFLGQRLSLAASFPSSIYNALANSRCTSLQFSAPRYYMASKTTIVHHSKCGRARGRHEGKSDCMEIVRSPAPFPLPRAHINATYERWNPRLRCGPCARMMQICEIYALTPSSTGATPWRPGFHWKRTNRPLNLFRPYSNP